MIYAGSKLRPQRIEPAQQASAENNLTQQGTTTTVSRPYYQPNPALSVVIKYIWTVTVLAERVDYKKMLV